MTIDQVISFLGDALLNRPAASAASIEGITEDSRNVRPGIAFVAVQGEHADGHAFAADAKAGGAPVIIGERTGIDSFAGLPYLQVGHARRALGLLAHYLAGNPTAEMTVIGVTGTNGKTTTAQLTERLLRRAGRGTAVFGTLGYRIGDRTEPALLTTPFGETLARLFSDARAAGCTDAVMEASSHAIEQERIAGVQFRGGVFTNLTQDHLDYHEDLDTYRSAKAGLFARLPETGFSVINAEDPSCRYMAEASHCRVYEYGAGTAIRAEGLRAGSTGTRFTFASPWGSGSVDTRLIGAFNVSNMLAAASAACAAGAEFDAVLEGLNAAESVPGRFEIIDAGQPFTVIVDYAHTEDGLRNVLASARPLCAGQLITVFGCGGDRDKTKRPRMASAVAEGSDFAVVTSDNPRTENPERILLDIEVGMQHAGKRTREDYVLILDRREAIAHAFSMARKGDLVLIAGKGHEDYQILGTERIHFDDREVARALISESVNA